MTEATKVWFYSTGPINSAIYLWRILPTESNGPLVYDGSSRWIEGLAGASVEYTLEPGNTYLLSIGSFNGLYVGPVDVHTSVLPASTSVRTMAPELTLGRPVKGSIDPPGGSTGDSEYFKFTLDAPTDVWVVAYGHDRRVRGHPDYNMDTNIELQEEDGTVLAMGDDGGWTNALWTSDIRRTNLAAGTYYVRVWGDDGFPDKHHGNYELIVKEFDPPGATQATATAIHLNAYFPGTFSSATDKDYYSIIVDSPQWVDFYISERGDSGNPANNPVFGVKVYDPRGSEVPVALSRRSGRRYDTVQSLARVSLLPGKNYIEVSTDRASGDYVILPVTNTALKQMVDACPSGTQSDAFYTCQWHLNNTGQFAGGDGADINVEEVWATNKGEGVTVAIVDDGVQLNHEDLRENVDVDLSWDYHGLSLFEGESGTFHGTAVAGTVAARDNAWGVRGVAPRATLYSLNLTNADFPYSAMVDVLTREAAVTGVSSNSWALTGAGKPLVAGIAWETAAEQGATTGFDGKGVVFVHSGGNYHVEGDNANLNSLANFHTSVAVCAIGHYGTRSAYSERGASLWVCAPSSGSPNSAITTTADGNLYTRLFTGTSAATPIVSGVVALIRAENPALTARDVKLILAGSARKNDPRSSGWAQAGVKYGSTSDRYNYSHDYGFGAVDAGAAVALAKTWALLPTERTIDATSETLDLAVGEARADGTAGTAVTSSLTLDPFVEFIEYIEVKVTFDHPSARDLQIQLRSPSGAVSTLAYAATRIQFRFLPDQPVAFPDAFRFGSARHVGEDAAGIWTLTVTDRLRQNTGSLTSWSIKAYGHGVATPSAPPIPTATAGARSLTVAWTAPADPPDGSMITITSYDLRYIRSSATNKTDPANWTEVTGIGTDDAGTYEITGLGPGVQYDVQVRALSNSSAGPWSESLVVRSSLEKPFVPSLTGVTPRDTGLGAAWNAPTEDGGSEITSYDLRTIRSNASQTDKDDPTQWDETFSAWTTGGVELRGRVANLTNGVRYDVQVRARNAIGASDWSGTRTGTPNVQNTDPSFAEETTTREVAENLRLGGNVGARISATDSNRDPLTYSIRGANDLFEIDAMNGQLRTKVELDADEGVTSHTLTVEVSDGLNSSDDEDLTIDDSIEVTIAVTNVNEQPMVEGTTAIDHAENEGTALAGASYSATDPERANIIWSLGGNDGGKFAISSGGVLSFAAEPDFDARADRNRDNIYEVTVQATEEDDGDTQTRELTGTLAVTVTLTDVNEPPVVRRRSGTGAFSIVENSGTDVGAFDATDPEGGGVTWSLATSGDHGRFEIDAANGALSFKEAPDYESSDLGSDKAYTVTVQATEQDDGEPLTRELTGDLDVTVTITNENEPPMVTRSSGMGAFSIVENSGREVGSFRADDPEGRAVTWSLATTGNHGRFEIDATRGVLSFKDPPDYESSDLGSGLVRAYNVTVRATEADDGDPQTRERRGSLAVTVTITNVNEPPVVRRSSGAGAFSIVENSGTDVGRFVATDPEGAGVTWSDLSGNDADDFDLSNNGVLTFKVSPDYEMKREYEVTLNAYDGRFTGRLDVTVTIANVNEQPMVARRSGTGPFSIVENSGTDVGDFEATDPEGHAVTWSLETTGDHARFEIDAANGALSLKETPDYESSDLGSDKAYNVTVRATEADDGDADPLTGTLAVTVRITNVNEPPTITPKATPSVPENTTAVATYRATDPDEHATITWSVEDAGAGVFTITNAGALSFASAPNYEVKSSYTVTVRASDGTNTDDHDVTVAVTDVDEKEVLELSLGRPLIGNDFTAAFEAGMGDQVQSPTWAWERSTNRNGGWAPIDGATAATYRPTGDDRDYFLRVTASYNDGHGQARKTLQATSVLPTLATSASNEPPAFPDQLFTGGVTGLSVPENANAPTLVGTAPQATDPESKPLRYSLAVSGFTTDPPFEINATSRQIRVVSGAALDHEDQETYSVTVTAEDEFNATDTATFDITVEDVNEPPVAEDDPSVTTAEDMPVTFDVLGNDTDPDEGDTLTVMTITTQPRRGRVVADPGTQMLTYTPVDNDHGTYTFTYTASDDDPDRRLTSRPAQVTVTVNSVNDAPEFATETTTRTVSEGAQPGDEVGTKLAATDVDDSTLTYSLAGASDFVIDASGPTAGQIRVAPGVTLDRENTPSYQVTVTATDRLNASDSITVTINVSDVPEPPTAMNDTATTFEDAEVIIRVLDNDTDPDTPQANLRVSVLRQPLNGRAHVESDRTITYTPKLNFADRDPFTYRLSDGSLTDDGSVTVTVIPVNDPPTFPSPTTTRSVPEDAEQGDDVGPPVIGHGRRERHAHVHPLRRGCVVVRHRQPTAARSRSPLATFDIATRSRPTRSRSKPTTGGRQGDRRGHDHGGVPQWSPRPPAAAAVAAAAASAVVVVAAAAAPPAPARARPTSSGP